MSGPGAGFSSSFPFFSVTSTSWLLNVCQAEVTARSLSPAGGNCRHLNLFEERGQRVFFSGTAAALLLAPSGCTSLPGSNHRFPETLAPLLTLGRPRPCLWKCHRRGCRALFARRSRRPRCLNYAELGIAAERENMPVPANSKTTRRRYGWLECSMRGLYDGARQNKELRRDVTNPHTQLTGLFPSTGPLDCQNCPGVTWGSQNPKKRRMKPVCVCEGVRETFR